MELEPITRQEKIIAGQDLTPITRLEMFLKQFGGSGGSVGGVGVFRVNLTPTNEENKYSADKTFDEIVDAYKAGMEVEAVAVESADGFEVAIYQLALISVIGNLIVFASTGHMFGHWYIFEAAMGADGIVTITSKEVS